MSPLTDSKPYSFLLPKHQYYKRARVLKSIYNFQILAASTLGPLLNLFKAFNRAVVVELKVLVQHEEFWVCN